MDDAMGRRSRKRRRAITAERGGGDDVQGFVVETVQEQSASLLRVAQRYSYCRDDAGEAYQRTLEIFLRRAGTLDRERAHGWLHKVVKHEALAVRRERQRAVSGDAVGLDALEARESPGPDEQALTFDSVARSAEALRRLKPQEVRALWLRAQGHSYNEIAELCGWSYTKVNRCLTEGRRAFLERYAGIESGDECRRWEGVLSAVADGEATAADLTAVRPHLRNCPGCRSRLHGIEASRASLALVFPVALVAVGDPRDGVAAAGFLARAYEALAGGLQERAVASATKMQVALEGAAAGKAAAVAASAAALAGGGAAVADQHEDRARQRAAVAAQERAAPAGWPALGTPVALAPRLDDHGAGAAGRAAAGGRGRSARRSEFAAPGGAAGRREFAARRTSAGAASAEGAADGPPLPPAGGTPADVSARTPAPAFEGRSGGAADGAGGEFGAGGGGAFGG